MGARNPQACCLQDGELGKLVVQLSPSLKAQERARIGCGGDDVGLDLNPKVPEPRKADVGDRGRWTSQLKQTK